MESLVIKMLKKHLKLFIKNFKPDQLSVSATKGEGSMTDLELNEEVIQELLYIPMNLAVTKSTCDLLTLKIPWTSLSSKPVTLTLNRVDIDLREPEEIKPRTNLLKKMKKKNEKSSSSRSDIMDNAQLVVNSVHITIQTLGGSLMMIDLEDIVIQSTNGNWQVVDLGNSRTIDKEQGLEYLYKRLSVRAISVALITDKSAHMILQQMPLQIQMTQKRKLKDQILQAADIVFVLEDVKFRWTRPEYFLLLDLVKGFQTCMARPVPEDPEKLKDLTPTSPTAASTPISPSASSGSLLATNPDVSFSIRLDKWTIDLVESIESEVGYSFFGKGLVVTLNAAKSSVQRVSNDKTGESSSTDVDESVITLNINTVNFRELVPRNHVHPFIVSNKDPNAPENSSTNLLKASLILRRPTEVDSSTKYLPLIGIDLSVVLSNLQIVADRRVWKGLIKYVSVPLTPEEKEKKKEEKEKKKEEGKDKEKEDIQTIAQNNLNKVKDALRLGEDWFNQIKLNIKASDLRLIAPNEEKGLYQNASLQITLGSFVMANFSDWKITPNLPRGIALLAAPSPAPPISTPKTVGVPQKLTFQIEGVSVAVHAGGRVADVLAPTGIKLFVHYYDRETKGVEKGKPHLEVIFQSGEFNLQANEQQFKYLSFLGRKYLNPRKIKSALSSQVDQAKAAAKAKIQQEYKEFSETVPNKEDMVTQVGQKVQSTLDAYKWIAYIHFNKGVFRVPLQFLLSDDEETPVSSSSSSVASSPLSPLDEPSEKGPSIEDLLGCVDKNACELKYENMDLAFENNMNGQGVVVQLGSFQATGLDHPKFPSIITLVPLKPLAEEQHLGEIESLVFRYKRKRKQPKTADDVEDSDEDYATDVWFRLQGMQVKVTSKANFVGPKKTGGMGLPDLQALVNKAVALLQERKSDIDMLKKNVEKVNVQDVKWGVELGNCEVLLEKEDKSGTVTIYKPYGTVRLADAQRQSLTKSYFEVETQLINAKSNLANSANLQEDLQTQVTQLQSALMALEADKITKLQKLSEDFAALESKFVEAKVSIAQYQMDNDNLKSTVNRLQKK